ncbi:MAG: InlB B-repeat-containing protein, partial [Candidatus Riflebacteria bacterium]|nr:InlB B-repeat-containing protein [Candidatus Riflebacteria bacterium]
MKSTFSFRNIFLVVAVISSLLLTACGGGGGGGGGTPAPTKQTSSVKVTIPGSLFPKQATEVRAATSLEKLTLKVVAYSNGKEKTDVKITDREATSNGTNFTATVDGLLNVYDYRFKVFHNNTELLSNQVAASEIVNDANITINIETSYKTIAYDSWLKKKPTNASMSNFKENSKTAGFTKDSDYKKLTLTIGNDEYTADQYKENLIKAANDETASLPTESTAKINVDKIATSDKEPEIVTYTISYNLDGGTLSKANPTKYGSASATITLNNPTKDGYNFTGWTGSNGNTPQTTVTIPKGSTGNKTFKANWEKIEESSSKYAQLISSIASEISLGNISANGAPQQTVVNTRGSAKYLELIATILDSSEKYTDRIDSIRSEISLGNISANGAPQQTVV